MQAGAGRQGLELAAAVGDVAAEVAGLDGKPFPYHVVEKLGVEEVHVTEIGRVRAHPHPRAVLDRGPAVGVAHDASASSRLAAGVRRLHDVRPHGGGDGEDGRDRHLPKGARP